MGNTAKGKLTGPESNRVHPSIMPAGRLARVNRPIRPAGIAPASAAYELAVSTPAGSRMLHTAGIVGMRPDGSVSEDVGDQAAEVWRSIGVLLDAAGFEPADIVKYTTYVVVGEALEPVVAARDRFFGEHRAASVLVAVEALAQPQWKVEVSVIAARTD